MLPHANGSLGGVDGERTPPGNEPYGIKTRSPADAAGRNPSGNGSEAPQRIVELSWDTPVNTDDVKRRFEAMTNARLTVARSRQEYWCAFMRMVECEKCTPVTSLTRKQLAGRKGKEVLIAHYTHVPKSTRAFVVCAIKKVWTRGLDLRWPLDRDDLPRAPSPGRRAAPRREYVTAWVDAAREAREPYTKAWLLVELNGGLRPIDQQAELRLEDLVYNDAGELIAIHALAGRHGFKRHADIQQALCPEVAGVLKEWLKEHPSPRPDAFVWPWKDWGGHIDPNKMNSPRTIERLHDDFEAKHHLPHLTPKDFRHFVRTVLNTSGLPAAERHYWQGHTPTTGNMDEQYGERSPEETFELQRRYLPGGVIGTFLRMATQAAEDDIPDEAKDVVRQLFRHEIEGDEAGKALREIMRAMERQRETTALVKP